MNRAALIKLLPCYVAGDLDEELAREIADQLDADAELARLADDLHEENGRIRCQLRLDLPPGLLERLDAPAQRSDRPRPASRRHRSPTGWTGLRALIAGIGVAAAAALGVVGLQLASPTEAVQEAPDPRLTGLLEAHQVAMDPSHWLDPDQPEAVQAALDAAEVPPGLRLVPDLRELGLKTIALAVLPGAPAGLAVVYEDGERRIGCQMWTGVSALGPPHTRIEVGDVEVRGYRAAGTAFTVFLLDGMYCVMSSDALDLEELLALTERRLRHIG